LIVEDNSKYVTLKTILKNEPYQTQIHEAINGLGLLKKFENTQLILFYGYTNTYHEWMQASQYVRNYKMEKQFLIAT
jgi:hypothetical protein